MKTYKEFLIENDNYDPEEAIRKAREVARRQSKAQITGQNTRQLIRQRRKKEEERIQKQIEKQKQIDSQKLVITSPRYQKVNNPTDIINQTVQIKPINRMSRKGQGAGIPSPFKGVKMGPKPNLVNAERVNKPSKNVVSFDKTPIYSQTIAHLQYLYNTNKFGGNKK